MSTYDHGWNNSVVAALQKQLCNAFTMYTAYKKYHWNCKGVHFRDLHLLFDEHAQAIFDQIDELGERIRMKGFYPVADLAAYSTSTELHNSVAIMTNDEMLKEAVANTQIICEELQDGIQASETAGDTVTADYLTELKYMYDKQLWFLKSILG